MLHPATSPHRRLTLWFQPQVDLRTGEVSGAEALLRELDDAGTAQTPSPALIASLSTDETAAIVDRAVAVLAVLRREPGMRGATMSVNLSGAELSHRDVHRVVAGALAARDVPTSALTVEVTETIAIDERASSAVHDLADLGVGIALDDFGTGFSSVVHVVDLPITEIKIDRAITGRLRSRRHRAVADAMALLARQLDLRLVAEGIEHLWQYELARELGFTHGQGYLLAPPMDAVSLLDLAAAEHGLGREERALPEPVANRP